MSRRSHVTTAHRLVTGSWSADVDALEAAIGRFGAHRSLTNECRVVFFEIPGDRHLHVNVTHRHETAAARGWAGPARLPEGFVHNRLFSKTPQIRMMHDIRDMVFAERI